MTRESVAAFLTPRAKLGETVANNWHESHNVPTPDYIKWEKPGTTIVGKLVNVRETPGRNGQIAYFLDIRVSKEKSVSCSAPTDVYSKLKASNAMRRIVRIEYVGNKQTGGKNTLKVFDVAVMPEDFDMRQIPREEWGLTQSAPRVMDDGGGDDMPSALNQDDDDDLPF